jgi:antitoxin HigA-1
VTAALLARDIDVPQNRISEIVAGRRNIAPDTAYRLILYPGTLTCRPATISKRSSEKRGKAIAARVRPPSGH